MLPGGPLQIARSVLGRVRRHDLMLYAAGLTFYAAIAVVPLVLLAVAAAAALVGPDRVAELGERFASYAPRNLGAAAAISALADVGPRLGPLAALVALVPATSYGEGLVRVFDRLDEDDDAPRKGLRGRLLSLVLVAVLPVVVLVGLGAVAVLPGALGLGEGARLLGLYATFLVGWLTSSAVCAVLYRTFPRHAVRGRALAWSSAATGSFLTGMSLGWVLVLELGIDVGAAFGGSRELGTLVLVGVYLFLVQVVLLVGYALGVELEHRRSG